MRAAASRYTTDLTKRDIGALVLATAGGIALYGYVAYVSSKFESLYAGFNAELPAWTKLFFAIDQYVLYLAAISVVPLLIVLLRKPKFEHQIIWERRVIYFNLVVSSLLAMLCTSSMYLPISKIGIAASGVWG